MQSFSLPEFKKIKVLEIFKNISISLSMFQSYAKIHSLTGFKGKKEENKKRLKIGYEQSNYVCMDGTAVDQNTIHCFYLLLLIFRKNRKSRKIPFLITNNSRY